MPQENYKPTAGEVASEMGRDAWGCAFTIGACAWNVGKFIAKPVMLFSRGFYNCTIALGYFPTILRRVTEREKKEILDRREQVEENDKVLTKEERDKYTISVFGGASGLIALGYGCCEAVKHDYSELLLIPVATNAVSFLYEWGRSAKQRVAERKTSDGQLEQLADGKADIEGGRN